MTEARYHVVTDLETTGTDPTHHDIIQLARTVVDVVERRIVPNSSMSVYVVPARWNNRSQKSMIINKISLDTLEKYGRLLPEALKMWCTGVNWDQSVVSAWGTDFEMKFLHAAFRTARRVGPYSRQSFDVRSMAHTPRMQAGHTKYLGLSEAARWYGLPVDDSRVHDAEYDVSLTCDIFLHLLQDLP